jgi:hypothetical protein
MFCSLQMNHKPLKRNQQSESSAPKVYCMIAAAMTEGMDAGHILCLRLACS